MNSHDSLALWGGLYRAILPSTRSAAASVPRVIDTTNAAVFVCPVTTGLDILVGRGWKSSQNQVVDAHQRDSEVMTMRTQSVQNYALLN